MSNLERTFENLWKHLAPKGMPEPIKEYRFHPVRKWRFDFAFPGSKVAVECEGAVYTQGRHTRGKGFEGDCEKYNHAASLGWKVFRVTTNMLKKNPHQVIDFVVQEMAKTGM